jgi:Leucine-rich repeat (LRR) protein
LKKLSVGGHQGSGNKVRKVLPDTVVGQLENLEFLILDKYKELTGPPTTTGNLTKLKVLNMCECIAVKQLPNSIGSLTNLIESFLLQMYGINNIITLHW